MGNLTISAILKRLMFEQGIKTMELARRTNLPQPTVHRIVSGDCNNPHQGSLIALAKYFDLTINQLKGTEPIPQFESKIQLHGLKQVPLISLKEAMIWLDIMKTYQATNTLFTEGNVSAKAFALTLEDSAMYPLFPKGTKIIVDPDKTMKDRSYLLIVLQNQSEPIFRQLIIDADQLYLKPLNPDLMQFKMLPLKEQDHILGVLVEARKSYED